MILKLLRHIVQCQIKRVERGVCWQRGQGANPFASATAQQRREQENLQSEPNEQISDLHGLRGRKKKLPIETEAKRARQRTHF